jgi:phosphatidylethanolamine/phosphatidyl-N-methylethanolamine N-methyltransferase
MKLRSVLSTYHRYAHYYDVIFGAALEPGRRVALRRMAPVRGQKILEIGVGTGLSLRLYPPGVEITGIDLCPDMLGRARNRVKHLGLENVRLELMNAQELRFQNHTFDSSIAMYVSSVTSDPAAMVTEMRRVTRRGGKLYILNHFSHPGTITSKMEKTLHPLASWLGFEPLFYLDKFLARTNLKGCRDIPIPPFGYWRLLEVDNI